MSRRLLITGGAGFIGANFTHSWCRSHPDDLIVVLDALTYAGNYASIASLCEQGRVRFVRGDIRQVESNWHVVLVSEHDDAEALAAYQAHPEHVAVGPYVRSVVADKACVDYEF